MAMNDKKQEHLKNTDKLAQMKLSLKSNHTFNRFPERSPKNHGKGQTSGKLYAQEHDRNKQQDNMNTHLITRWKMYNTTRNRNQTELAETEKSSSYQQVHKTEDCDQNKTTEN